MTRLFNRKQRDALFIMSGGVCRNCGLKLERGWHADHRKPHSKGGETDVVNGQALCPDCNRKKGATVTDLAGWPEHVTLRHWQAEAWTRFLNHSSENFLTVATPGAGKTRFALRVAHDLVRRGRIEQVIVVVPSAHLKKQWASAATPTGLNLDPEWTNQIARQLEGIAAADYHGVVVTYQQVASSPDLFRLFCMRPTLVICDEIHHAGDEMSWGSALRSAFEFALFRLLLSGTPFRSDNNPIPFVTYIDGRSHADYPYGYADALGDADRVVRTVWFPSFEGRMDWIKNGDYYSATFADTLAEQRHSERLMAALNVKADWLQTVIREADQKLTDLRVDGHSDAAGLIIAYSQWHAWELSKLVLDITGHRAIVAVSDDPEASDNIKAFTSSKDRWLIAVRMVSEGVDLPRLRVGVYATNYRSELFFRQFVGRFVRRLGDRDTDAYIFLPADPMLLQFAEQMMEERDHEWKRELEKLEQEAREARKPGDDTFGLFVSLGATDVHADRVVNDGVVLTPEQLAYARQLLEQAGMLIQVEVAAKLLYLAGALPNMPAAAPKTSAPGERRPLHEIKKDLKKQVHNHVNRLHFATDQLKSRGEIYVALKKVDGVDHNEATLDQQIARLALLERWIGEVRDARQ